MALNFPNQTNLCRVLDWVLLTRISKTRRHTLLGASLTAIVNQQTPTAGNSIYSFQPPEGLLPIHDRAWGRKPSRTSKKQPDFFFFF
jgi:hypothetical protein